MRNNVYKIEEAKEKFCPLLHEKCCAASCMWWRWYYEVDPKTFEVMETFKGYCGGMHT